MIGDIRIFERLNPEFPEKAIFLRLGGNCFKTALDQRSQLEYMRISRDIAGRCEVQGRYIVLPIEKFSGNGVEIASQFLPLGEKFCQRAGNAEFLWCGAVTIGNLPVLLRNQAADITAGTIADAVGSECADAAMDMLGNIAGKELRRAGLLLDERRFSPGYGDMPLVLQEFFYQTLNMAQMGVTLTENNYLLPEKSVTAFAFIHRMQNS